MKRKHWLTALALALILAVCAVFGVTAYFWNSEFRAHYDTDPATAYAVEEFGDVNCERFSFSSDRGQELAGYLYTCEGTEPSGLLVMAHGFGGGGQDSYMPVAVWFARAGYSVFSYDATGCDASGGDDIRGLPQGVIDLDRAISFAESLPQAEGQSVFLFGHSWGAYCVCSVLAFHPEVKAVASLAGFNTSADMIRQEAQQAAGPLAGLLMPAARLIERMKLGSWADCSSMKGFAASGAAVMVIHGAEDEQVPLSCGYGLYQQAYGDDPRFVFLLREGRGHDDVYYSDEAVAYIESFNTAFRAAYAALPEMTDAEKTAWRQQYLRDHLDRELWDRIADEELLGAISDLYQAHA